MTTVNVEVAGIDLSTPRAQVLLALADDALIGGHRASHWTGVAPSLEEDLAFSTIAQDGINHADVWYQLLISGADTGGGHANADDPVDVRAQVDALGLGRRPQDYRHAILCERPPRDFAFTLARHWAYEHFEALRLEALVGSSEPDLAAVAVKLGHEIRYHLEHADHWFDRLSRRVTTDRDTSQHGDKRTAHARFEEALSVVLPEALGLFEPVVGEPTAVDQGIFPVGHAALRDRWIRRIGRMLEGAGYGHLVPASDAAVPADAAGGRFGRHGPDFTDDAWPEMTALYRAHPGARW